MGKSRKGLTSEGDVDWVSQVRGVGTGGPGLSRGRGVGDSSRPVGGGANKQTSEKCQNAHEKIPQNRDSRGLGTGSDPKVLDLSVGPQTPGWPGRHTHKTLRNKLSVEGPGVRYKGDPRPTTTASLLVLFQGWRLLRKPWVSFKYLSRNLMSRASHVLTPSLLVVVVL